MSKLQNCDIQMLEIFLAVQFCDLCHFCSTIAFHCQILHFTSNCCLLVAHECHALLAEFHFHTLLCLHCKNCQTSNSENCNFWILQTPIWLSNEFWLHGVWDQNLFLPRHMDNVSVHNSINFLLKLQNRTSDLIMDSTFTKLNSC